MDSTEHAFSIDDRIVLGDGLFETIAVNQGMPLYADLHWARLTHSARLLKIVFDISLNAWIERLNQCICKKNLRQGGLKVILSAGRASRGLAEHSLASTLVIQSFEYTRSKEAIRLMSALWLRDSKNPVYHVKSVNYLEAISARRQAEALGFDDALFYNTNHHATETTCANLFVIHKGQLMTPPLTDGVLPGITRSRIIAWCARHHISCMQSSLNDVMIKTADAVFITNALQGIQSVQRLDRAEFSLTHPLIHTLMAAFSLI
jgi:4-amino-4-deoxychorismate lyase